MIVDAVISSSGAARQREHQALGFQRDAREECGL
jgi:hypothetical protein